MKWFREQAKMTQDELATALQLKDRQSVSDIENGKRRVDAEELVSLSRLFHVPVEALLDPFKLVGEGCFNFRVEALSPSAVDEFAERAGSWIATYRELGRQAGIEPTFLGQKLELSKYSSFEDAAASAEGIRERWRLGESPAESLQHAIERELGVLVLYVDAPHGLSGAASHLPGLQTILVNRSEVPSRRAFDLAHELFHVLTWDAMPPGRVESWEPAATKGNRVEQLANVFAASLLMPEKSVRSFCEPRRSQPS
ncbi:MAG: helix-turn-helix domain-containing protein [Gemmatimonadetes bacterium]|nr:helix-turn-helix domain-containing protein [Gemmatimonadota bacterium]